MEINEYFEEIYKFKKKNTNNQKIKELENYFNYNEENKIETEKKIKQKHKQKVQEMTKELNDEGI